MMPLFLFLAFFKYSNKYVFCNLDKISLSLRSYSRSEFNHPRKNSSAPIESGRGWTKSKDPAFPRRRKVMRVSAKRYQLCLLLLIMMPRY
ncbi:hypothetical protein YC2023_101056 [Brassica napus]